MRRFQPPFRIWAPLLCCFIFASCAAPPRVNKIISEAPAQRTKIVGPRGPLTAAETKAIIDRLAKQDKGSDLLQRHLDVEQALVTAPLVTGNRATLLHDGPQTFNAIFKAIRDARHYVLLEYYIFENVESGGEHLLDLLLAKRQQGVKVAIIYDGYGSMDTPNSFFARLKAAGVKILEFHPLNPFNSKNGYSLNDRDHRKILIADGTTAILGGVNLYTAYQRHPHAKIVASQGGNPETWHDLDIEIEGPAVREVQHVFRDHWIAQGGPPLKISPPRPQAVGDDIVRIIGSNHNSTIPSYDATLLSAIRSAGKTIWLTTAYFVPTKDEMHDLEDAARRGVDVRLMLPGHSDSALAMAVGHSDYGPLLKAGVKIFEYQDGILHSKWVVIDGVWSTVGSSNFDHRSVLFNDEVDAIVLGNDFGQQLQALFEKDEASAKRVTLAAWEDRSLLERFREFYSNFVENLL